MALIDFFDDHTVRVTSSPGDDTGHGEVIGEIGFIDVGETMQPVIAFRTISGSKETASALRAAVLKRTRTDLVVLDGPDVVERPEAPRWIKMPMSSCTRIPS